MIKCLFEIYYGILCFAVKLFFDIALGSEDYALLEAENFKNFLLNFSQLIPVKFFHMSASHSAL